MSRTAKRRHYVSFGERTDDGPVLLDFLNINIIKEMVDSPDVKSSAIATKYKKPLSTVQRRRTKLEHSILKKGYRVDISQLGWREADLMIGVQKGDCEEVATKLLETPGVISASLRIGDPDVNIMAQVYYKTSQELQNLVEGIRRLASVTSVSWSEVVKVLGSNNARVVGAVFSTAQIK
jgi:DNA-binding Lrp family transcriptional regulator